MDIGKILFENLNLANDAARIHLSLGRAQIAREILSVLETETNDARAIARVLNICVRETK